MRAEKVRIISSFLLLINIIYLSFEFRELLFIKKVTILTECFFVKIH
jgi:hypothetical protein